MNSRQFDAFVGALGRSSPRRRVLSALGGAALGGLAVNRGAAKPAKQRGPATARSRRATEATTKSGCSGTCGSGCDPRTAVIFCDPTNPACACFRSVTGKTHCADASRGCPDPGAADECQQDADCGIGGVCVPTAGGLCCRGDGSAQVNICVTLCGSGVTPERSGKAKPRKDAASLLGAHDRLLGR